MDNPEHKSPLTALFQRGENFLSVQIPPFDKGGPRGIFSDRMKTRDGSNKSGGLQ
jgi:hypothetical protein